MERSISGTASTSNPEQMSQDDQKGQSLSQADFKTIIHRLWIDQSSM